MSIANSCYLRMKIRPQLDASILVALCLSGIVGCTAVPPEQVSALPGMARTPHTPSPPASAAAAQPDWPAIKSILEGIFRTDQDMRMQLNKLTAEARERGAEVDKVARDSLRSKIKE